MWLRSVPRIVRSWAVCALLGTLVPAPGPGGTAQQIPDARALGVPLEGTPGPHDAITDVGGVEVGHATVIRGEGRLAVGEGPVRTGVTAILPRGTEAGDSVFAAWFPLNGNGEMTGTAWVAESGILESPVVITNTHSVGVARDAVIDWMRRRNPDFHWALPVVAETFDGSLNDINGFHVRSEHVFEALDGAGAGPVEQGSVGGGTGMICHAFKGGIGSASRVLDEEAGGWTVGVLVQCNQGARRDLRVAGAAVGEALAEPRICYADPTVPAADRRRGVPLCEGVGGEMGPGRAPPPPEGAGSIIIVLATDAPLLPHQVRRLVKRTALGLARIGGMGYNGSGDLFIGFSTANRRAAAERDEVVALEMLPNDRINPLVVASVRATEAAILNAMLAAETMTGANGLRVPELPEERLRALMEARTDAEESGAPDRGPGPEG